MRVNTKSALRTDSLKTPLGGGNTVADHHLAMQGTSSLLFFGIFLI
jgi:hypothetical protein